MPEAVAAGAPAAAEEWRSLGGTAAIHVAAGDLFPLVLIIGSGRAVMHARMTRPGQDPGAPGPFSVLPPGQWREPQFADVTVVDDRQAEYTIAAESAYVQSARGARGRSARLRLRLSAVPGPDVRWLELRGPDGAAARLLPSPRPVVRMRQLAPAALDPAERKLTSEARALIGLALELAGQDDDILRRRCAGALRRAAEIQRPGDLDPASPRLSELTRLCAALTGQGPADHLPRGWSALLDAGQRADGPLCHLDLGTTVPAIDGVTVRVDSLVSERDGWRLYLRAMPAWWKYSADGSRKRSPVSVIAADDRGGTYVSNFDGSTASSLQDSEELVLRYLPRLDPAARSLTLTFLGSTDEVTVDFDLR